MRWRELGEEACSMARAVSVIGDRWTLLILRDCFLRVRRFEDFQERLGITRPILADRLKKLVDEFSKVRGKKVLPFNAESDLSDYLQLYTDLSQ